MKLRRMRIFLSVLLGSLLVFSLAGLVHAEDMILRIGVNEQFTGFDIMADKNNTSNFTAVLLYAGLVAISDNSGSVGPMLASSWEMSEDSLTWTFHLRDAYFSTGELVTAADVIATLDARMAPESRWASFYEPIASIEAVDEKTVVLHLSYPFAPLLQALAGQSSGIVPAALLESGHDFNSQPVGAGAFKL